MRRRLQAIEWSMLEQELLHAARGRGWEVAKAQQQKNQVVAFTSAVKQVVVVQKAAGDGATEPWLRVTLEYPLDNPAVLTEIAELKGEAIHVELSHHQLTLS